MLFNVSLSFPSSNGTPMLHIPENQLQTNSKETTTRFQKSLLDSWKCNSKERRYYRNIDNTLVSRKEDREEIENQVIHMASIPLEPLSSSSNNTQQESSKFPILLKRLRNPREDDLCCSASSSSSYSQTSTSRVVRPFKAQKRDETLLSAAVNDSGSDLLLNSLRKFHQQTLSSTTTLDLGISIHDTHPVAG